MTEVATELNIKTETELCEQFARYGVSKATYEFYTDIRYYQDMPYIEFYPLETELHGNIPDEVYDELDEAFQGFAAIRAIEGGKTVEDEIATLIYDVATRLITLEGDFETSVHIKETYKPDEH